MPLYSSKETTIFVSACHNTGIERESTSWQSPENLLRKRLWTWRKRDCAMNERMCCSVNFLIFIKATVSFTVSFECRLMFVFKNLILLSRSSQFQINLLKPTGHVMHQQFNIQQSYVLPT